MTFETNNGAAWHFLAIAYGRSGNMGMAALAQAEQNLIQGNYRQAEGLAMHAKNLLPPGAKRQRAEDLASDARRDRQRQENQ